jgi:hypothetical protein
VSLRRFIDWLLPSSDVLQPRPRVTPDPQQRAELERRFGEIDFVPEFGFITDHPQQRKPQ